jgi:superfamily I DNA and/or RNA helicase
MNTRDQLLKTLELIRLERAADLEYYRQKVLLRSLHQRTREGTTWYPVRLKREYIGTGERLMVEVERTQEIDSPHGFQGGKSVSFFSNDDSKPERDHVKGVVNYVRDNVMVITLNADDWPDWIEDRLLGVDVMFDEMSYREMEAALKAVIEATNDRVAAFREVLLGNATVGLAKSSNVQDVNTLNDSQNHALKLMTRVSDVGFIHGPPGTGKTTTLVQAIRHVVKEEHQTLVCAPSNAAVDLLVEKLSDQGLSVLRIGHPARVTEQSLSKTLDARISEHPNFKELRGLRKKMEQLKNMALKFKRQFGYAERQQRKLLLQESKALKGDADVLEFYIINDIIQQSQVICSTLVGSSHPVLGSKKFKTVFVDEAAQALEPATWIPLLRSYRVIFAGDHQQLPPTLKSLDAGKRGLSRTLFEKGIERHPDLAMMLKVQYRMNEHIMRFSSEYFYHNGLIAHTSVKDWLLTPDELPVTFVDTAGCGYGEHQDPETLSRYNEEEATLVVSQVVALVERIGVDAWIENGFSLGIITPYRAQVDRLVDSVHGEVSLQPIQRLITINTVDAFQGQERDVIVISFVRSNDKGEIGFLGDIRRTNVAMTRAKKKLMMFGDSATLGGHPFYATLLDFVQEGGFYKSAFELVNT